jgi:hypothetical protein
LLTPRVFPGFLFFLLAAPVQICVNISRTGRGTVQTCIQVFHDMSFFFSGTDGHNGSLDFLISVEFV